MSALRRTIHATVCLMALIPWTVGMLCLWGNYMLNVLAHKIWPTADWGNCWSALAVNLHKHGGYTISRRSDDVNIGPFGIPHAIWALELPPGTKVRMSYPLHRHKGKWFAWIFTLYFPYEIRTVELPHDEVSILERKLEEAKVRHHVKVD
jgi:hypothetical protein